MVLLAVSMHFLANLNCLISQFLVFFELYMIFRSVGPWVISKHNELLQQVL